MRAFRVIDTGVQAGRFNIALDQALIDARKADRIPDSVRFLRFEPTALIGRHQCLTSAVDRRFCAEHGIATGRRVTGGGALYLDQQQLGWELVFDRRSFDLPSLAELTRAICEAAASGLRRLDIAVRFRPRNDLEVDGRKLGGSGGFFDGTTIFFQGTVLIDLDADIMFGALKVPGVKNVRHGLSGPAQRVVGLRELMDGKVPDLATIKSALLEGFRAELGIEARDGELSPFEWELAERYHEDDIGTDEFVHEIDDPGAGAGIRSAMTSTAGGTLTVFVKLTGAAEPRIDTVIITGDFFVTPPRIMLDLEASLKQSLVRDIDLRVMAFFARTRPDVLSLTPADIAAAIRAAALAGNDANA